MRLSFYVPIFLLVTATALYGDVIILHDGSSYTGSLNAQAHDSEIAFTGENGVGFTFPERDVQSLVFTPAADTVTLRNGKTYSGHYAGGQTFDFIGAEGIDYKFPEKDVASIVFTHSERAAAAGPEQSPSPHPADLAAKVIPEGADISIRTDEKIDSKRARGGELFRATIAADIPDSRGGIAVPGGSPAKLVVRDISTGGAVHTPELVLDLFSVDVGGKEYRTITSNVVEKGRQTVGMNRRTAEYTGGGTGLGALLGGIFGGGSGAGIGALAGAGGGALTQLFTRGKQVKVPAEATLTFRLDRTLVLRP